MDEKDTLECEKTQKEIGQEALDFNTVIDKVGDGITVSDKEGHFEIFNKRMQEVTGYTIEEANSLRDFTALLYPDPKERNEALNRLNEIVAENGHREIETIIRAKDGSKKVLLVSTSFIRYRSREMFLSIYHDITERKEAEERIESLAKFPSENPFPVLRVTKDGRIIYANKSCISFIREWNCNIGRQIPDFLQQNVSEVFQSRRIKELEVKDKDKTILFALVPIIDSEYVNMYGLDISERRRREEELRTSEKKCRSIITTSIDGFWVVDKKGCFLEVNEAYCRMTGYAREELLKMSISDVSVAFTPEEIQQRMHKIMKSGYDRFETRHKCKDGRMMDVEVSANYTAVGGEGLFFMFLRDISERKWLERELKDLALKDSHTGLFNHRYLKEAIDSTLARAKRQYAPFSVIMMDLDYFKSINDVYGHIFGDLVLKQFAGQLKKIVRAYDIVIRYGGEEFIIISPDTGRESAIALCRRILDKINLYNFGDARHKVKMKLSLGICSYPQDNILNSFELVKCADQALAKAKESGGNRACSSLDLGKQSRIIAEKPNVDSLKKKINKLTIRVNQSLIESIFAFAKTIELKDHYTGEHVERSVHYATRMAEELNLPKDKIEFIKQAAMLHDLGKVGISEKILVKKSKLNRKEFEEIKKHPLIGADIIRPIHSLHPIIPLILYHHERWDGKGYPHGLKKENIPLGARIIAIADVYQALVSNRPYRKAYSKAKAIKIIKESSGTQFDPEIVKVFLKILEREK